MDPVTLSDQDFNFKFKIAMEEPNVIVSHSVDSSDPQERVATRRLRVRAKLEARKQAHMNQHHVQPKIELEEKRTCSQQQLEASEQRLLRLSWDGVELVTNVERALMSREAERRQKEAQARRDRIEKLQAEAQEGQEHFETISRTWCTSEKLNVSQDLHSALCNQQQECLKFIGRKNHMIGELHQELSMRDESFVQCLKQQAEDITLIIERSEHRTQDMMFAQQEELETIEKAFEKERQDFLLANEQEWEQQMKSLQKCKEEHTRKLAMRVEEHQQAMNELRYEEFEGLAEVRTRLLTNIQELEEQIQQMQVTFQMNQDKLDYNLHILRKQDQEDNAIFSQQKRKRNRQYEVLNKLKETLGKHHHKDQQAVRILNHDVQLLMEQQEDLQHRMRQ
uniref:dynein regulatory complex protein 1-like isoform X2 n=1 Tax=Myxine glutinosa TaxID=7769 RepID=UPI00358F76F0